MPLRSSQASSIKRPRFWFYPYGPSESVNNLIRDLNGRIIRRERSQYVPKSSDVIINWGAATRPAVLPRTHVLNSFEAVRTATSKLSTFAKLRLANVAIPEVTLDRAVAASWNSRTLGRDLDHGSQGRGITVYERGAALGNHQFYVKYWRKQREFRIHVFQGRVIFIQEKLQKNGARDEPTYNKYIRSHDRGWCFAFNHLEGNPPPDGVGLLGVHAVSALGLDFGATDIGWNDKSDCAVFEVNTAPGIEESSLTAYVNAFKSLI